MDLWVPLAERLRPTKLEDYVGQSHLMAKGKPLYQALVSNRLHSMILWGPPGTGKTTLAKLLASHFDANLITLSAVLSGVKDIREAIDKAKGAQSSFFENKQTLLFIDEIHRFNKSQQDSLLPHVESGTVTLIGATTENPSFELNNALLSRARVYILKSFSQEELIILLKRAMVLEGIAFDDEALTDAYLAQIACVSDGDGRRALNFMDMIKAFIEPQQKVTQAILDEILTQGPRRFDKKGEYFYDQISALHKSVRGSSPDGAIYWLTCMLESGCDRSYLARRLIRMATEDIGNADPRALDVCLNAAAAYERLGTPEGELALVQAAVYLSVAPKSNAVYEAYNECRVDVTQHGSLEVPYHIRNAPTVLMKENGYGAGYQYDHDSQDKIAYSQTYLPDALLHKTYYRPTQQGLELKIAQKLESIQVKRNQASIQSQPTQNQEVHSTC